MDKYVITGGKKLVGEVTVSGAKNAAVAIIPATILAGGKCRIENIPDISDVRLMLETLKYLGATVKMIDPNCYEIDTSVLTTTHVPGMYAEKMRASYYFLGAMLGRCGSAEVPMPGGCNFGVRPIDQHIKGFEALGARVVVEGGKVTVDAKALRADKIVFDVVTVGATMNVMLAAVMAEGQTVIENAAKEPHIVDLANFLNLMGADVRGAGTDTIKIRGVKTMHGCDYSIIPDQIEAGTYMVMAAAAGGDVTIKNVIPKHLESITAKLIECGAEVEEHADSVRVYSGGRLMKCNVKTMPHPGFPTDMQPQIAAMLSVCEGTSIVSESIWDNRFRYVEQLLRMGATIRVEGKAAIIEGVPYLKGAPVRADDLRAGAAMLVAGLIARGTTEIENIHLIERGYEHVIEKMTALGADIRRVRFEDPVSIVSSVS